MNNMYKTAAALLAGVMLTNAAVWPLDVAPAAGGVPEQEALVVGSASAPLLAAQETAAGEPATPEDDAPTSEENDGSMPVAQQIVAGILTGMLAAIITLRILFYWRRNRGSR